MTADRKKQTMQTHSTGFSPQALYSRPPSTGPVSEEKELMVLMTELAVMVCSGHTRAGMLACTEG